MCISTITKRCKTNSDYVYTTLTLPITNWKTLSFVQCINQKSNCCGYSVDVVCISVQFVHEIPSRDLEKYRADVLGGYGRRHASFYNLKPGMIAMVEHWNGG